MTAGQLRAARAMLDWTQRRLCDTSGVSVETIKRLEAMPGSLSSTRVATIEALQGALEDAGIEFLFGDTPGVKLRSQG